MECLVHFEDVEPFYVDGDSLRASVQRIVGDYAFQLGDLSVVFCSEEYILKTNQEFLNHDYYTDIITFDYSVADVVSGDLVISVDTVSSNALQYNADFFDELFRVCIHGLLHLVGLGDKTDSESVVMREKEALYLSLLDNPFVSRET